MIKPGSRVLVVGLGKSGLSAVRFLKKHGADVLVTEAASADKIDKNIIKELLELDVEVGTGGHSPDFFQSVHAVLISPGVPLDLKEIKLAAEKGIPVFGELALAKEYLHIPTVAITGTNGKSTVTKLIGDLFKTAGKKVFVGGNIGTPLTDYLIEPQGADVAVLEVSSFQLDTAGEFKPDVAVLLNLSPDHLDRYDSYDAYCRSKMQIFAHQKDGDIAILNYDDSETLKHKELWGRGRKLFFGNDINEFPGAKLAGDRVVLQDVNENTEEVYSLAGTLFVEAPNNVNALAAILVARLMGCPKAAVQKALNLYEPLPHRMSLVAIVEGVRYYDDSKATNIGAVEAALSGMEAPVILIAGGRDKGGDYTILHEIIRQKVKTAVLIGEAANKMAVSFKEVTSIKRAATMEEAVKRAHQSAQKGDTVLLSPACSSFDMFKSYGHRGDVYKTAVRKLKVCIGNRDTNADMDSDCASILSCD